MTLLDAAASAVVLDHLASLAFECNGALIAVAATRTLHVQAVLSEDGVR